MKLNFRESTGGVYQIVCLPTGNTYIGSTVNFARRWQQHRDDLRFDTHANYRLTNLYHHYGMRAFEFSILEICAPEQRLEREQAWIDRLDPVLNIQRYTSPADQLAHETRLARLKLARKHIRTRHT